MGSVVSGITKAIGKATLGALPVVGPMLLMQELMKPKEPKAPEPPKDDFKDTQTTPMTLPTGGQTYGPGDWTKANPYAADPFAGMSAQPVLTTPPEKKD